MSSSPALEGGRSLLPGSWAIPSSWGLRFPHPHCLAILGSGARGHRLGEIVKAVFVGRYLRPQRVRLSVVNAYVGSGDSGSPLYICYRSFALVYGITVGGAPPDVSWAHYVNAIYTIDYLCRPTAVNPLYNITNALRLIPYSYSGR